MTAAEALQRLLAPILAPIPVILSRQNAPRPAKPYAALDVQDNGAAAWLVEGPSDANGNAVFTEHRRVSAEVQLFGQGAMDRGSDLGMRLRLPRHVDRAIALGVSVARVHGSTNATLLLNEDQYEERGIFEFTAYHAARITDDLGLIEHADLDCSGPDGTDHQHLIDAPARAP